MYNRTLSRYLYANDGDWTYLNPWSTNTLKALPHISTTFPVLLSGTLTVAGDGVVSGTLSAGEFEGNGMIPVGGIIPWYGPKKDIPPNYKLCDGIETTPDLTNKFIVAGAEPGGSGGTHNRSTTEIVYSSGLSSESAVSSTENRPSFYILAFIKRVE